MSKISKQSQWDVPTYIQKNLKLQLSDTQLSHGSQNGHVDINTPANTAIRCSGLPDLLIDQSQKDVLELWSRKFTRVRSVTPKDGKVIGECKEICGNEVDANYLQSTVEIAIGDLFSMKTRCKLDRLAWYNTGSFTHHQQVGQKFDGDDGDKCITYAIADITASTTVADTLGDIQGAMSINGMKIDSAASSYRRMNVTMVSTFDSFEVSPFTSGYRLFAFFQVTSIEPYKATVYSRSAPREIKLESSGRDNRSVLETVKSRGFKRVGFLCKHIENSRTGQGRRRDVDRGISKSTADMSSTDYAKYQNLKSLVDSKGEGSIIVVKPGLGDSLYNSELYDMLGHCPDSGKPKRIKIDRSDMDGRPRRDEVGKYKILSEDPNYRLGDVFLAEPTSEGCERCECDYALVVFDL